jgi:hypothetical protein
MIFCSTDFQMTIKKTLMKKNGPGNKMPGFFISINMVVRGILFYSLHFVFNDNKLACGVTDFSKNSLDSLLFLIYAYYTLMPISQQYIETDSRYV